MARWNWLRRVFDRGARARSEDSEDSESPEDPEDPVPVVLYTRAGCELCEDLARRLEAVPSAIPWRLERVDVDGDPELARRYGERIPVLWVGGRSAFAGRTRAESVAPRFLRLLRRYARRGPGPGLER